MNIFTSFDDKWSRLSRWLEKNPNKNFSTLEIVTKMIEIEFESKMARQGLTEICMECGMGKKVIDCNCEHSKQYFDYIKKDA